MASHADDIEDIQALVSRQFQSMSWQAGGQPDAAQFAGDFHADALLYPSARPLRPLSVGDFTQRMLGLAATSLPSFDETVLGSNILVFGNVAIAAVACETRENEAEPARNVEMMLLVKDAGRWMIAAQAWDRQTADRLVTDRSLAPTLS